MAYLRAGDVIENEVRDIERGQVMQCFEADVRDLGIFLGGGSLIITMIYIKEQNDNSESDCLREGHNLC